MESTTFDPTIQETVRCYLERPTAALGETVDYIAERGLLLDCLLEQDLRGSQRLTTEVVTAIPALIRATQEDFQGITSRFSFRSFFETVPSLEVKRFLVLLDRILATEEHVMRGISLGRETGIKNLIGFLATARPEDWQEIRTSYVADRETVARNHPFDGLRLSGMDFYRAKLSDSMIVYLGEG